MPEKQPSINCDSTVAAINEFILSTTQFLNAFASTYFVQGRAISSCRCESKLTSINNRITALEMALSLVETKINSAEQESCRQRRCDLATRLQPRDGVSRQTEGH